MPEQLLSQKPVIERYLHQASGSLSAFSFTNIFAWQDFFEFDLKVLHGHLCVFAKNSAGCFLYLPPLGRGDASLAVDACFDIMEGINGESGVTRVENVGIDLLPLFSTEKFAHYKKGYEYCYYRDDIAALRGNAYKSKRSSFNRFAGRYRYDYLPYEEGMLAECMALYEDWAHERERTYPEDIYGHMLRENRKVHETVLRYFRPLGLTGRVVRVDGKIRAYSFGFAVNPEMFCVLFEIADLDAKGLAVYLFREFCRDASLRPYKFINVMDDFGLDNIRQTKMSFRPSVLLPMYTITKRTVPDGPVSFQNL